MLTVEKTKIKEKEAENDPFIKTILDHLYCYNSPRIQYKFGVENSRLFKY